MSNRNGQGPMNEGPMTGRGRGRCAVIADVNQDSQTTEITRVYARQAGRKGQAGCGLGRGNGGGRCGGGRGGGRGRC